MRGNCIVLASIHPLKPLLSASVLPAASGNLPASQALAVQPEFLVCDEAARCSRRIDPGPNFESQFMDSPARILDPTYLFTAVATLAYVEASV